MKACSDIAKPTRTVGARVARSSQRLAKPPGATFGSDYISDEIRPWRPEMPDDVSNLDQMQSAYQAAVEEWIAAIKQEEALASVNHSIAEIDKWEQANFKEDEIRAKVKAAKKQYEDALREQFFGF
jgi:hypothetical protein